MEIRSDARVGDESSMGRCTQLGDNFEDDRYGWMVVLGMLGCGLAQTGILTGS